MKLSPETIKILSNFSSINSNLVIRKGNKIETVAPSKDIIASYEGDDIFDKQVSIFNMNELLGVISAFDKPELDLNDKSMTIKQGKSTVNYIYAEESLLIVPPAKGIVFPISDVTFKLSDSNLSKLLKMSSILSSDDMSIVGNGKNITIMILDLKNPSANQFELELDETTSDNFQINFKIEKLKLLPGNYTVDISAKKISRFVNDAIKLTYWIAIESSSNMGDLI